MSAFPVLAQIPNFRCTHNIYTHIKTNMQVVQLSSILSKLHKHMHTHTYTGLEIETERERQTYKYIYKYISTCTVT